MGSNDLQLEMNFSEKQQNRFRKTVESGTFSLLIESFVPGPQLPAKDAVKQLRALEEEVAAVSAKDYIIVIPNGKTPMMPAIKKDSFTIGTSDEFIAFLKSKGVKIQK